MPINSSNLTINEQDLLNEVFDVMHVVSEHALSDVVIYAIAIENFIEEHYPIDHEQGSITMLLVVLVIFLVVSSLDRNCKHISLVLRVNRSLLELHVRNYTLCCVFSVRVISFNTVIHSVIISGNNKRNNPYYKSFQIV